MDQEWREPSDAAQAIARRYRRSYCAIQLLAEEIDNFARLAVEADRMIFERSHNPIDQ
jgi:F420-0:gamma-glutamyl ligase